MKQQRTLILVMVLSMVMIAPLSVDEYTPSLPHMVKSLGTTTAQMQLTVTLYMFAFAISQLIFGPIADRIGRRRLLIRIFPLFLLGTALCACAQSESFLFAGRILQGLGVGPIAFTSSTLISDSFEGAELTHTTSLYSTVYSFVPIAAPLIGGFIQDIWGWQANFLFVFIFAFILYLFYLWKLPETHKGSGFKDFSLKKILHDYGKVLRNKHYIAAATGSLLMWAIIIVFSILAPFIIQNTLAYTAAEYGIIALIVGVGFMIGGILNTKLLKTPYGKNILQRAMTLALFCSLIQLTFALNHYVTISTVIIPTFLIMICVGIGFPNFYAIAISAIPELPGLSNAMVGTIILMGAVIITSILTLFHAHSLSTFSCVYTLLSLLGLLQARQFSHKGSK